MYQVKDVGISDVTRLSFQNGGLTASGWIIDGNSKESIIRKSDIDSMLKTTWHNVQKGIDNLENLYSVTVVSTSREILIDKRVIATTVDNAKFISGVYGMLQEKSLTLDDVTIIVNTLGSVKVAK